MSSIPSLSRTPESHATARVVWPDEAATARAAAALARVPALRDALIELHGELGAGKTTFARHLLRALGVGGRIKSPTFTVVEPYELPGLAIWHFDFYRFTDPHDWEDAGLRELFGEPGLKLVEWPRQAGNLLPIADLKIKLRAEDDSCREVGLEALTERGLELLAAVRAAQP